MTDNYAPHWRLEALKIAVKTFDQDDPIPGYDLFVVANDILKYILTGTPEGHLTPRVPTVEDDFKGPVASEMDSDERMKLTLKDMPNYSSGKTTVSTVERRQHPEQEDEDDDD